MVQTTVFRRKYAQGIIKILNTLQPTNMKISELELGTVFIVFGCEQEDHFIMFFHLKNFRNNISNSEIVTSPKESFIS